MAITTVDLDTLAGLFRYESTDILGTIEAVKGSSTVIHLIDMDNAANGAATFYKFWNVASGSVTVGTTAPDMCILVPASTRIVIPILTGVVFGTALSVAAVTTAGTAGTTSPTSDAILRILYV